MKPKAIIYKQKTCKVCFLMPRHNIVRPRLSKLAPELILRWHPLLGMALPLRVVCFPSETPLEEANCSFASGYQL